jgi:RNA polymerase sigma factor (sigma-70 family)
MAPKTMKATRLRRAKAADSFYRGFESASKFIPVPEGCKLSQAEFTKGVNIARTVTKNMYNAYSGAFQKAQMDLGDCMSEVVATLLKRAKEFDPGRGAQFKTVAFIAARGTLIDKMRYHTMHMEHGGLQKNPKVRSLQQLADKLGVDPDYFAPVSELPAPSKAALSSELTTRLAKLVKNLTQNEQAVITLYYSGNPLRLKTIATMLDLSEARVSQLHLSALRKLNKWLKQQGYA